MKQIVLAIFCIVYGFPNYAQKTRDITHKISSEHFDDEREIQVHLPKQYEQSERLPVIFVFDAQWDTYYKLVTSTIDYLIETREFPKSIVIGINAKNRQYELTPEPVNENWKVPNLGGAKLLENHISKEVVPFLEKEYHIENFRVGIGHSLGGTFVLNSLIDNPELFNAYIAISSNFQIDDEEITLKIQRKLSLVKNYKKFFYTTIGTEGNPDAMFLPPLKRLDTIMQKINSSDFDWNFKVFQGFNHATIPLPSIHSGLLRLSEKWKISEEEKEEISKSQNVLSEFKRFYTNLSEWVGYTIIPSKNDYYSFIGYLETNKKYNDAITLYKSGIDYFSAESRFYNGIAENLWNLGDVNEAETYTLKALEVLKNEVFEYADDKAYFEKLYKRNLKKIRSKHNKETKSK